MHLRVLHHLGQRLVLATALGLAVVCGPRAHAVPLTDELIREARKIAVYYGTFCPYTRGHQSVSESSLLEDRADLVIVIPNNWSPAKLPVPIEHRLAMIHAVHSNSPRIVYPYEGEWGAMARGHSLREIASRIRQTNPAAEILGVAGEDASSGPRFWTLYLQIRPDRWLIAPREGGGESIATPIGKAQVLKEALRGLSSSKARAMLIEHPGWYSDIDESNPTSSSEFSEPDAPRAEPLRTLLHERVIDYILDHRLFLDGALSEQDRQGGLIRRAVLGFRKLFVTHGLIKLRIWEPARELLARWQVFRSKEMKPPTEYAGHPISPIRELNSGLYSRVWLVHFAGRKAVLKKGFSGDGESALKAAVSLQQHYLSSRSILIPGLIHFDEHENWALYEYVEGPLLKDFLRSEEVVSPSVLDALTSIYFNAKNVEAESGISLDLRSDNIILRHATADAGRSSVEAVLVDLGPLRPSFPRAKDFASQLELWKTQARSPSCLWLFD